MTMTKEEAVNYLHEHPEPFLQKARKRGYICPLCKNGTGEDGDGITTKDGIHYTCWKCQAIQGNDLIDIIAMVRGCAGSPYPAKLERACQEYNITLDASAPAPAPRKQSSPEPHPPSNESGVTKPVKEELIDNSDYLNRAYASLQAMIKAGKQTYLETRGISAETQKYFAIGYDAEFVHPKRPQDKPKPVCIIPSSKYAYLARDTRAPEAVPENDRARIKMKVGSGKHIFFYRAIEPEIITKPVFVTEGEIDAMSIFECLPDKKQASVIAIRAAQLHEPLLNALQGKRLLYPLVICLDNDNTGTGAQAELVRKLKEAGHPCITAGLNGNHKDINERLQANRPELEEAVKLALREAYQASPREDWFNKYSSERTLDAFIADINRENKTYIETGFINFDKTLAGGLYSGLHIVGAMSSLGKTTLCLQIADYIAKQGRPVLFFTLEMSAKRLQARSISRITAEIAEEQGLALDYARNAREVLNKGIWASSYKQPSLDLIDASIEEYRKHYARNLFFVYEPDITASRVIETINQYILFTGKKPVVFLDYLQKLAAPPDSTETDKNKLDNAVKSFIQCCNDNDLAMIAISSMNRASYQKGARMEAYNGSGEIEYSADMLLTLQFKGQDEETNFEEEKQKETRSVELVILKNRDGETGAKIPFDYVAKYNLFRETGKPEQAKPSYPSIEEDIKAFEQLKQQAMNEQATKPDEEEIQTIIEDLEYIP